MDSYIKSLESNSSSIQSSTAINLIINSFVNKYKCSVPREKFLIANQKGLLNETASLAKEYIDCFSVVVNNSKSVCSKEFENAFTCFEKNQSSHGVDVKCVTPLEELLHCNVKQESN